MTAARADATVQRFSAAARVAHWVLAVPFLLLIVTGLLLFLPPVKALHVGGYRLVPLVHVLLGLAFIAGFVPVYLLQPGRRPLRNDLRRLFHVEPGDAAWLRYALYALLGARVAPPPVAKFNAGQKLNTLATALLSLGLSLTGLVLAANFFSKRVFPAAFVEAVYPYHDLLMLISLPIIAGHIFLAALYPGTRPSLHGMLSGRVSLPWARAHHPSWAEEAQERRSTAGGEA